jgi:hypothetical protein
MPPEENAVLRIESSGNVPLYMVERFLSVLEHAYNYVYVGHMLLSDSKQRARWREVISSERAIRFALWVPKQDRLILKSVELHSPGSWEFLGKLNPLETIRQYLQDRHERRKDKQYKESAEKRGMELDNMLKENQVLSGQIDNARKLGATEKDLRPMLERFIRKPLQELDKFEDERIAGKSSVTRSESDHFLQDGSQRRLPLQGRRIRLPDEQ